MNAKMTLTLIAALLVGPAIAQQDDVRLQPLKDLNGFFPLDPPATLEAWEERAAEVKHRVLVANGLWPMPEKTPLNAVIHGKVERPGFTAEKVYFESLPGLFVTGLLFRPSDVEEGQKLPAVLSPHGHGGRLQDHGEEGIKKHLVTGSERFAESGRMPKVARAAGLARQGYIVFLYDMIGYADNLQLSYHLGHRFAEQRPDFEGKDSWGLYSAQAEMRLQSIFGIQTWNSIRALDFLESLPDTDPEKLGVTGGSGGGTQTIMLCAIDPRPAVAFPNGMVSSSMQGGCTCENASLLRIGTGNVELTALFAPKPQGMTSADDWTREMLVQGKGFHELQKIYELYGKKGDVFCEDLTHFPHNYNYVSRALMYSWFNKHLNLGLPEPIVEEDFKLITKEEHAVWNDEHPQPEGGDAFERKLTKYIADQDQQLLDKMSDQDRRNTVRAAWRTMIGRGLPKPEALSKNGDSLIVKSSQGVEIVKLSEVDSKITESTVIYLRENLEADHPKALTNTKGIVLAPELFLQSDGSDETRTVANKREFAGYTHGYNHSLFAQRTHDVLAIIAYLKKESDSAIHIVAEESMGPIAAAATVIAGDDVDKLAITNPDFRFANISSYRHPSFIPGAVKYGDFAGLLDTLPEDKVYTGHVDAKMIEWLSK